MLRSLANVIDKTLRGANPGDIPLPTRRGDWGEPPIGPKRQKPMSSFMSAIGVRVQMIVRVEEHQPPTLYSRNRLLATLPDVLGDHFKSG